MDEDSDKSMETPIDFGVVGIGISSDRSQTTKRRKAEKDGFLYNFLEEQLTNVPPPVPLDRPLEGASPQISPEKVKTKKGNNNNNNNNNNRKLSKTSNKPETSTTPSTLPGPESAAVSQSQRVERVNMLYGEIKDELARLGVQDISEFLERFHSSNNNLNDNKNNNNNENINTNNHVKNDLNYPITKMGVNGTDTAVPTEGEGSRTEPSSTDPLPSPHVKESCLAVSAKTEELPKRMTRGFLRKICGVKATNYQATKIDHSMVSAPRPEPVRRVKRSALPIAQLPDMYSELLAKLKTDFGVRDLNHMEVQILVISEALDEHNLLLTRQELIDRLYEKIVVSPNYRTIYKVALRPAREPEANVSAVASSQIHPANPLNETPAPWATSVVAERESGPTTGDPPPQKDLSSNCLRSTPFDIDQVVLRYEELINSKTMSEQRNYKESNAVKHNWTAEELDRAREAFKRWPPGPTSNKKIAQYIGGSIHPKHVIWLKKQVKRNLRDQKGEFEGIEGEAGP